MNPVRVFIKVEVTPPQARTEPTSASSAVEHGTADGQLVTRYDLIVPCAEEAIEIAAQRVLEMVKSIYPST